MKIITKINKKIKKKIENEIEIQRLKIFIFQINEMFYFFDFIFVFAFIEISIQKVNDKKQMIVMIMKIVLKTAMKIENLKFIEEILIFASNI